MKNVSKQLRRQPIPQKVELQHDGLKTTIKKKQIH